LHCPFSFIEKLPQNHQYNIYTSQSHPDDSYYYKNHDSNDVSSEYRSTHYSSKLPPSHSHQFHSHHQHQKSNSRYSSNSYGEGSIIDDDASSFKSSSSSTYDNETPEEGFMEAIYDMVDAVVPPTDNIETPTLTFRVWIMGTLLTLIFSFINTLFTFRSNPFTVSPIIGVLLCYPFGVLLSKILPTKRYSFGGFSFTLNPGPFTYKESTLIFIFASCGANPAYGLYNIIGQKYKLGQDLTLFWCIIFALVTQCLGYGLAGLTRRYIVRPAAMIWPGNWGVISLLTTLHEKNISDSTNTDKQLYKTSRLRFFMWAALAMFIYQWLPSFIAPSLMAISTLCYMFPTDNKLKLFGSATQGTGFLTFTFDWTIANAAGSITTPLWALVNQFVGVWIFTWILIPWFWSNNVFGNDQDLGANPAQGPNGTGEFLLGHALNYAGIFDANGTSLDVLSLLSPIDKMSLDVERYDAVKPIRISTYFAIEYVCSFMVVAAVISHVALWYGKDLWMRLRTAMRDLDENDKHAQMMVSCFFDFVSQLFDRSVRAMYLLWFLFFFFFLLFVWLN
jgi:hypothetical protein